MDYVGRKIEKIRRQKRELAVYKKRMNVLTSINVIVGLSLWISVVIYCLTR